MTLLVAAIAATVAAIFESTITQYLRVGDAQPHLVFVLAVVWTVAAGLDGGLVWAFVGGLVLDTLAQRPLGSTAFALLLVVGATATLTRALHRFRPVLAIVATALLSLVYSMTLVLLLSVLRPPVALSDSLVAPSVLYDVVVALALIIGVPLLFAVLWLMQSMGAHWWLWVWLLWVAFSVSMFWAFPALIAPLFNRFRPLERAELAARIQALLARTGFRSRGVFVMDGSRRSAHGNAYFTGLGRNKRIVFFDTLLDSLNETEVEAVLAHELGHFKRKHVLKRMLLSFSLSLAGLAVLGWLHAQPAFYHSFGVSQPSTYTALALFLMVSPVFGFWLQPLFAWGSRRHEFEADAFAAQESDAQALMSALVKLYEENASTLTPDPLYSAFYNSHPPALRRIAHLQSLSAAG